MRALCLGMLLATMPLAVACPVSPDPELDGGPAGDAALGEEEEADCTALAPGRWTLDGSCFGHAMQASLSFDDTDCSGAFSDWSMAMDTPEGVELDEAAVAFTGAGWTDCSGVASSASSASGSCSLDGCTWTMARTGD